MKKDGGTGLHFLHTTFDFPAPEYQRSQAATEMPPATSITPLGPARCFLRHSHFHSFPRRASPETKRFRGRVFLKPIRQNKIKIRRVGGRAKGRG